MSVLFVYFTLFIFLQTFDLHGTWRCHKDEVLWVDPEREALFPGSAESINYYGWGFVLYPDGKGKMTSINSKSQGSENNEFTYTHNDSLLVLGHSEYIIEELSADTLIIRAKRNDQISVIRRFLLHKE